MKKIKYLLVMLLLLPTVVFATNQNTKVSSNMSWDQCIANTDSPFSSNGYGYFSQCKKITCLTGKFNQEYLFSSKLVTCTNGNKDMYTKQISTGCSSYSGSCSPTVDVKYCSYVMYYDCNKTSDGRPFTTTTKYIQPTTKPTTKPTTTTKRRTTSKTTTKKTTSKTTTTTKQANTQTTTTTTKQANNNAFLSSLKITPGTIEFDKETLEYLITVDKKTTNIEVEAIPEESTSTVIIKNNTKISEKKPIYIIVTAEDKVTKKEYKINIKFQSTEGELSSNSALESLEIKGYNINFKQTTKEYTLTLDKDVTTLDITAKAADEKATYKISGNEKLKNKSKITITVTAEDETTTEYIINIRKKSSNTIVIILIIIVLGIAGVVGFKLIRNLIPAKEDENYNYE